jgi:hypothetical protein
MLASITPLGERSRNQRWWTTAAALLAGGAAGGAAAGVVLAALGSLLPLDARGRLVAFGLVLAAAAAADARPAPVPSHRRQVDDAWLRRYRGWVYGAGFGVQLGSGLATVVTTAAVYATLGALLLAPNPLAGAVVGLVFGAARGAAPVATVRVTDPRALARFHRRFRALDAPARRVAIAAQLGLALAGLVLAA